MVTKEPITLQPLRGDRLDIGVVIEATYLEYTGLIGVGSATADAMPQNHFWLGIESVQRLGVQYHRNFNYRERQVVLRRFGVEHPQELEHRAVLVVTSPSAGLRTVFAYTRGKRQELEQTLVKGPTYESLERSGCYNLMSRSSIFG